MPKIYVDLFQLLLGHSLGSEFSGSLKMILLWIKAMKMFFLLSFCQYYRTSRLPSPMVFNPVHSRKWIARVLLLNKTRFKMHSTIVSFLQDIQLNFDNLKNVFICLKNLWKRNEVSSANSHTNTKKRQSERRKEWRRKCVIISSRCHQTPQHVSHCWSCARSYAQFLFLFVFPMTY